MKTKIAWYEGLALLFLFYLFTLQIQAVWPFTIDDMYIPLRYSKNWVSGGGLLWNLGQAPVEGYSSFSFVLLGAFALWVQLDPVLILKMAGVLGLGVTAVFVYGISRFWLSRGESLLAPIILLVYKGQILWAVSGLETAVYEALLVLGVYFIFKGMGYSAFPQQREDLNPFAFLASGLFFALASITRPEAPVLVVFFFLLLCKEVLNKPQWKSLGFFLAPLLLLFLPYFLWRWQYYGLLFPNPVYCKGSSGSSPSPLVLQYVQLIWGFAGLALFAWVQASKDKRCIYLVLPSVLYCFFLLNADPLVGFDNRLFLPAFALLLPLALKGLTELVLLLFQTKDKYFFSALIVLLSAFTLFFVPWMTLTQYRFFTQSPIAGEHLRMQVVQWLYQNTEPSTKVVLGDSGLIPYSTPVDFIDSYCLNNKAMVKYPSGSRYELFCQQMAKEKPPIIILTSVLRNYEPADQCLQAMMKQEGDYQLASDFSLQGSKSAYRYSVYVRRQV